MSGFLATWRGFLFLLKHRRLLPLAIVPVLINTVLFGLFFYFSLRYFHVWLDRLLPQSDKWYWLVLIYFLTLIVIVLLLLLIVFTFTVVANILASPFNDALSSRTEALVTGRPDETFSLPGLLKELGRTVIEELKKLGFYLLAVGAILILLLVPVIGSVLYTALMTVLTIFWLGLGFLDYAMARHQYRLGDKLRLGRTHLPAVMGYGLSIFLIVMVPVLNLALIPAAVVGGTLLFIEIVRQETS